MGKRNDDEDILGDILGNSIPDRRKGESMLTWFLRVTENSSLQDKIGLTALHGHKVQAGSQSL